MCPKIFSKAVLLWECAVWPLLMFQRVGRWEVKRIGQRRDIGDLSCSVRSDRDVCAKKTSLEADLVWEYALWVLLKGLCLNRWEIGAMRRC
jgi:hypothetical protein